MKHTFCFVNYSLVIVRQDCQLTVTEITKVGIRVSESCHVMFDGLSMLLLPGLTQ